MNSGPRRFVTFDGGVLGEAQSVAVLVRHRGRAGEALGVFGGTMRRLSDHPYVVLAPVASPT